MYIVFDVSANGRPKSYKAPVDDTFNWPRLMHLSWIILDADLKPKTDYDFIIKPNGWVPTDAALKSHHLSAEQVEQSENELKDVLDLFKASVQECTYVFAHNLAFNEGILGSEYYRSQISSPLIGADSYCLMHEATYYCKLPGKRGYKWPSLQEMHTVLFKQGYTPTNNARADVIAAARCFIYLKKKRAFEDIFFDD